MNKIDNGKARKKKILKEEWSKNNNVDYLADKIFLNFFRVRSYIHIFSQL